MKNILVLILVFTACFQAEANKLLAGSIDYEKGPFNHSYIFYLTLYEIGMGDTIPVRDTLNNNSGPVLNLLSVDTISFLECGEPILKIIYKSRVEIYPSVPAGGINFFYNACCMVDFDNSQNSPGSVNNQFYISLTIFGQASAWSPIVFVPPVYGTWASGSPDLFNLTLSDTNQSISIRKPLIGPGIDSIETVLAWPFVNGFQRIVWESGYDQFAPLPDTSENPLNAPNQLDANGYLSFRAASDTVNARFYRYGIRYNHYYDGDRFARQFVNAATVIVRRDSLKSQPVVELRRDGVSLNQPSQGQTYNFKVLVGDTLNLEIIGRHSKGQDLLATFSGSNIKGNLVANDSLYNGFQINSLNPNFSFLGQDSVKLSFTWVPLINNYLAGPVPLEIEFKFIDSTCSYPIEESLKLRIKPIIKPVIVDASGSTFISDTLKVCPGDSISLRVDGDSTFFAWQHPDLINQNTIEQWQLEFLLNNPGWVYLTDSTGNYYDSLYLDFYFLGPYPLFTDSMNLTFDSQSINPLDIDAWYYNDLIPLYANGRPDQMLIQGSGIYSFSTKGILEDCVFNARDTVDDAQFWGSLSPLGSEADITSGIRYPLRIYYDFEVLSQKGLSKIFILGLEPSSVANYSFTANTINYRLLEGSTELKRETNSFVGTTDIYFEVGSALEVGKTYRLIVELDTDAAYTSYKTSAINFPSTNLDVVFLGAGEQNQIGVSFPTASVPPIGFKFDSQVLSNDNPNLASFSVYPNPSTGLVNIRFDTKSISSNYRVISTNGIIIKQGLARDDFSLDFTDLPKGIYHIVFDTGLSQKIIKH